MLGRALIAAIILVGGACASAVPAPAPRFGAAQHSRAASAGATPTASVTGGISATKLLGQRIMVGLSGLHSRTPACCAA